MHLLKNSPAVVREDEIIWREEGCTDNDDTRITHSPFQKPCCCSSYDVDLGRTLKLPIKYKAKDSRGHCSPIPDRPAHLAAECRPGTPDDEIENKASTSNQFGSEFGYQVVQHLRIVRKDCVTSSATIREQELLDSLLLLHHMGIPPCISSDAVHFSIGRSQQADTRKGMW
ncbi:hypothetical protein MLD38_009332 [Melastoma candidum]|uniref:Uncharacterized protein n=1 Tax=Melastoma candidum TaxID=119954 RepID=A0ACB9RXD6_9MYRT|nr:hypothetical protein MLD38_009332 [Melastoma candidum]